MVATTTNMALPKAQGSDNARDYLKGAIAGGGLWTALDHLDAHQHNGSTGGLGVINLNTGTALANPGDVRVNVGTFTYRDNAGSPANHTLGALDITQTWTAPQTFAPTAVTSGVQTAVTVTAAANTGLTASTEVPGFNYNGNRTQQWATGALATQREVVFQAPTYGFVGASTITTAATVAISGAPTAGTNATITNPLALWVQAGASRFDGTLNGFGAANTAALLNFSTSFTGSANANAVRVVSVLTPTTGNNVYGLNVAITAGSSTENIGEAASIIVASPAKGNSGTITSLYGIKVASLSATSTTAYGVWVDTPTGGGTNYSFYTNGTGASSFGGAVTVRAGGQTITAGNLGVGAAQSAGIGLLVGGTNDAAGTFGYSAQFKQTMPAGVTANGVATYHQVVTAAAAFTMTTAIAGWFANASKGAGSAITTNRGIYVEAQTAGSTNNYGVDVEAPSGGSGDNYAIRSKGVIALTNDSGSLAGGTADVVKLGAYDLSAGNATLSLATETAVTSAAAGASDAYLNVRINGTTFKLLLHT